MQASNAGEGKPQNSAHLFTTVPVNMARGEKRPYKPALAALRNWISGSWLCRRKILSVQKLKPNQRRCPGREWKKPT
jgi:hypothetical protein